MSDGRPHPLSEALAHIPILGQQPGRYNDVSERVREDLGAQAVVVIVIGGLRGDGMSATVQDHALLATLPDKLERTARNIRRAQETGSFPR